MSVLLEVVEKLAESTPKQATKPAAPEATKKTAEPGLLDTSSR